MGKKSLYHPVSLYVVRGAASYGGFAFRRISQTFADFKTGRARYRAELLSWPAGFEKRTQAKQTALLNNCFSADIWVTWVGQNKHGRLCVNFATQSGNPDDSTDAPEIKSDLEGEENA